MIVFSDSARPFSREPWAEGRGPAWPSRSFHGSPGPDRREFGGSCSGTEKPPGLPDVTIEAISSASVGMMTFPAAAAVDFPWGSDREDGPLALRGNADDGCRVRL